MKNKQPAVDRSFHPLLQPDFFHFKPLKRENPSTKATAHATPTFYRLFGHFFTTFLNQTTKLTGIIKIPPSFSKKGGGILLLIGSIALFKSVVMYARPAVHCP
ncbi:hypothetical protein [Paenibacillus konkukensis]|uniref:hypothetical protein n=1 Tax=Paenibacillus konkukensis TaxID=2020716 RepID=UPI00201D4434|nr:hypothetical protein [Paenibacillus konkukensis]